MLLPLISQAYACRIWHHSLWAVAGFHRASPSTTLDKSINIFWILMCYFSINLRSCHQEFYPVPLPVVPPTSLQLQWHLVHRFHQQ